MSDFFSLRTKIGTEICLYDGKLSLSSFEESNDKLERIFCFFSKNVKNTIFICTEDINKNISYIGSCFSNPIYPFGWDVGASKTANSIFDILDHNWLSFPPLNTAADIGQFKISNSTHYARIVGDNLDWEEVNIEPYQGDIPDFARKAKDFFDNLYSDDNQIESLYKILKFDFPTKYKEIIFNSIYFFLKEKDLEKISKLFFLENDFSKTFFSIFYDNFWVEFGIRSCISWNETRQIKNFSGGTLICDETFDFLQHLFEKKEFSSIFHALNFYVRKNIIPTKKACVVTTVRNEGIYLLEWIAWHKVLGFEHIFIYTNDNDDGSDILLENLANIGEITLIKNNMGKNVRPQAKVCVHTFAILEEILDYEWALVIDSDEFLAINHDKFNNVNEYIRWAEKKQTDAIGINWKYMASDEGIPYKNSFVTDRRKFIAYHVIGAANNLIKSMSKPNMIMSSTAHNAVCPSRNSISYRLANGYEHRYAHNSSGYSDNPMWADINHHGMIYILHYHYKSSQEFLLRLYRGDVLKEFERKDISITSFDENLVHTFNSQFEKYGPTADNIYFVDKKELSSYIGKLRSIPSINSCISEIIAKTNDRISLIYQYMRENKDNLGEQSKTLFSIIENNL